MLMTRRPIPADFAKRFVELGRNGCEEHYGAGRHTVMAWLQQCDADNLTAQRREYVRAKRQPKPKITRREMAAILAQAFPLKAKGHVNPRVAQAAARFLQHRRNGGWVVTRAPNGLWRVGLKVMTPFDLVEMAKAKGFDLNLSRSGNIG